ncbi:MAG: peptidoglycan DD-metalloendopeptidase family protein [Desulfotomaculaceae bacterium]|nr:peptidoglycan DD-metalloendopeptidase family protein [Desulfotomaculaceae bacterium]MDD4767995.1 peptidoglycan DD-metalloendopeptidase family protein [Desulfotomaculaceae bacterium]
MPLKQKGLRRLPGLVDIAQKWFAKQTIPHRILIGVVVSLTLTLSLYAVFAGNACAVKANGEVIAIAADESTAKKALAELVDYKTAEAGSMVNYTEEISYKSIWVRNKTEGILDVEELKTQISSALTFKMQAAAILVNGEQKILLKSRQEAETLLGWLESVYHVEPADRVALRENVEIVDIIDDIGGTMSFDAAKKMALLGSNKVVQYTVKDGDNLWDISRAVNIDQDQLISANPGLNPENLRAGQMLYLNQEAPLITVIATREVTVDEKIPYSVNVKYDDGLLLGEKFIISQGVPGERTVTYRITRENGLETGREVRSQVVKSDPKTEEVVKGAITMVASRGGSLRLSWPCEGGVVSSFGMRWGRMHEGIDLAADYGSSVVAVAGGTVVDAGWDGGYGMKVDISHGGGLVTRYAHLSEINAAVGDSVNRGETIGLVGSTGNSTGPHLHFETVVGGEPCDPLDFLP